jgi:hypothetical protein
MQVAKCPLYFDLVTRIMGQDAITEHGLKLPWIKLLSSCHPLWRSLNLSEGHFSVLYLQKVHVNILQYVLLQIQYSSKKLNLIQSGIIFELHLPDIFICKTKPVVDPVETSFVTLGKQCPLRLLHNTLRKTLTNTFCLKSSNSIGLFIRSCFPVIFHWLFCLQYQ